MGINWGADNSAVNDFMEVHAVGFPCASGLEGLGNQITEQYDIQSHISVLVITPDREIAGQFYYPYLPTRDSVNNLLLSLGAQMQDCTTGMPDEFTINAHPQMNIFPNPVSSHATIQLNDVGIGNYRMEIFNNFGELIRSFPVKISSGSKEKQADFSNLTAGYYFIRLRAGTKTISRKIFIKQ